MTLDIAIEEAQRHGNDLPTPPNEASTCAWVIEPLLRAAGYKTWEIISQGLDGNNSFPDYTILHNSAEHTWYLEAKAWTVALADQHANQALNYSHQNGKRWVILTNGQQWRLYDDWVVGVAKVKLVAEVKLTDTTAMNELLSALSKESVTTRGVEAYVNRLKLEREHAKRQCLLRETLDQQLMNEGSPAVLALLGIIRKVMGLEGVTAAEIVAYFNRAPSPSVPDRPSVQLTLPAPTIPVFWQHFLELAKQLDFSMSLHKDPWPYTDYDVKIINPNKWTKFRYFVRPEEGWAEIYIEGNDPSTAQSRFEAICSKRKEIEQAFQLPLVWEYKPGLKHAKIRCRIPGAGMNEVKKWPVLHAAMIETMKRLMTVTTPYLEELN